MKKHKLYPAQTAESEKELLSAPYQEPTYRISQETIRGLMDGDPDSFKTVFMTYHTPLENFLAALLRSRSDAEEFSQQIMLEIWENRDKLEPTKNIGGLIYTMAKRKAFSFIRHKYVHQRFEEETLAYPENDLSLSVEDIVVASETELLTQYVLSRMPERRRKIYQLSREEGLTYEEIARKLDISPKTVEYNISQALKEFREVLTLFAILIFTR